MAVLRSCCAIEGYRRLDPGDVDPSNVALFLILIQFFTGAMLAFNYAPTPGDAYSSLRYILTQVTAGRLMRGLHHWGASMLIVIVVLHMVQVFLWGAYKKPREGTWMVGVILLLGFFISYTLLLSWADFSFVQPASSLSYVIVALLGHFFLREFISPLRWAGIALLGLGQFGSGILASGGDRLVAEQEDPPSLTNRGSMLER